MNGQAVWTYLLALLCVQGTARAEEVARPKSSLLLLDRRSEQILLLSKEAQATLKAVPRPRAPGKAASIDNLPLKKGTISVFPKSNAVGSGVRTRLSDEQGALLFSFNGANNTISVRAHGEPQRVVQLSNGSPPLGISSVLIRRQDFLALGHNVNGNAWRAWLVSVPQSGSPRTLWSSSSDSSTSEGRDLIGLTSDNLAFLSWEKTTSGSRPRVVKSDANGRKLWDKAYGSSLGESAAEGKALLAWTEEDSLLLVGMAAGKSWLLKIDETTGEPLQDILDDFGDKTVSQWTDVAKGDGYFVLVGWIQSQPNEPRDVLIRKIWTDGTTVWTRVCGGRADDAASLVKVLADDSIFIGAETRSKALSHVATDLQYTPGISYGFPKGWFLVLDAAGWLVEERGVGEGAVVGATSFQKDKFTVVTQRYSEEFVVETSSSVRANEKVVGIHTWGADPRSVALGSQGHGLSPKDVLLSCATLDRQPNAKDFLSRRAGEPKPDQLRDRR